MEYLPSHFYSIFFVFGLFVVANYAWQRFNEPSFTSNEALPSTVVPLRYLFLRRAYWRARLTYLAVSLALYSLLVWPGPSVTQVIGLGPNNNYPPEAWALVVALLLVGFVPNSNMKWLTTVEDHLRRFVHSWFLVPEGVVRTVELLEDARYEPTLSQLEPLRPTERQRVQEDLRLPPSSLRHRWARATMLMESLGQMGAGAEHPLKKAAFEPFQEDFKAIRERYNDLAREISSLLDRPEIDEKKGNLKTAVDGLQRRIYAYISWGIRYQADSVQDIDRILEALGFSIPVRIHRSLFDIVAPASLLVGAITIFFWLSVDTVSRMIGAPAPADLGDSVVYGLSAATAASVMYGGAVFIALNGRSNQIEKKTWRQGSSRCLVPIALRAGLVSWAVIIISTALSEFSETKQSLVGLWNAAVTLSGGTFSNLDTATWQSLPRKMFSALPWLLAGATVSVVLAKLVGGEVRRTSIRHRVQDALILGFALGSAAAAAQLFQIAIADNLGLKAAPLDLVPILGLAGFACGGVVGLMVPYACRLYLVSPSDRTMARQQQKLLRRAETVLGTREAGEDWLFRPHLDLDGITPAEAAQHQTYATSVQRLLDTLASNQEERPMPLIISGGRS